VSTLGKPPYLCLITPGNENPSNFESEKKKIVATVGKAIDDGVGLIQIREKALAGGMLFDLVSSVVAVVASGSAKVLVNDRADIALAACAHGVHLPEKSFPPDAIRRMAGPDFLIGVSTHSVEQAVAAAESGADYAFLGPAFETPGKGDPIGLESIRAACAERPGFPIIALGGVDESNFESVLKNEAAGIAAIRALNDTISRREICRRLKAIAAVK
jgi:thiamine-phosphate pyrophosphorylase